MGLSQANAEIIAVQVLEWIVANDELLPVFLGSSGASIEDLREGILEPELLAAVMDFVLMDDAWVTGFAEEMGYSPTVLLQVRGMLPGGETPNFT